MFSQLGMRFGASTGTTGGGGNVVSPNNNNNNADAQAGDAPNLAGDGDDELNEDLGVFDDNTNVAAAEDVNVAAAEDAGLMRERAAAAVAARAQMGMGAHLAAEGGDLDSDDEDENEGDTNRLFDDHTLNFEHICPITHEAPLNPVLWGPTQQVFERQAVLDYVSSTSNDDFVTHPVTRAIYLLQDFPNVLIPVNDYRRPLIMAERQRLGLEIIIRNNSPFDDEESSGDELLAVGDDPPSSPPARRRRTNNGGSVNIARARGQNRAPQLPPIGEFIVVSNGDGQPQMNSPSHAQSWSSFVQLANNHEGGIHGSLGHGRRTAFINANTEAFFGTTGPFARFQRVTPAILQTKIGRVITAARRIFNQDHSNGEGGNFEDIPEWARIIFPLFDGSSQRDGTRREHQAIVRGVSGAQAPVGVARRTNNAPVQLRNERSTNNGDNALRQRFVGNVDIAVEGSGDRANRRVPPGNGQRNPRNSNRSRLRNVHLHQQENREDTANNDYAGRRADDIRYGLESMRMLVNGIHHGMVEQPRRNVHELLQDHRELEQERVHSPNNPNIGMLREILLGEIRSQHNALSAPQNPRGDGENNEEAAGANNED